MWPINSYATLCSSQNRLAIHSALTDKISISMKLLLFLFPLFSIALQAKVKVACVGDSITFGAGVKNRQQLCYPAQLGKLLGDEYHVENFGISARTMLAKGNYPYTNEKVYKKSLKF